MLFDSYVMFIFILYYGSLVNTITILSIFNYLHKFDGRVLYPHSWRKGFYDALDKNPIKRIFRTFTVTKNGKRFRTRSSKNVHTDKRSYKIYQPYHTPEKKSRKTHPKIPPQFDTLPADSKAPRHTPSRQRSASIHSQPTAKCLGPPPSHQTTRKLSLSSTPSSAALTAHPTPAQPP